MPNCFQLTRIGDDEPMPLAKIDEMICAEVGEPVHPREYCRSWYDTIGWSLAMGRSLDEILGKLCDGNPLRPVAEFLKANFVSDAWAQRH